MNSVTADDGDPNIRARKGFGTHSSPPALYGSAHDLYFIFAFGKSWGISVASIRADRPWP